MQKHFEYRRGQDACKSLSVILSKQLWALDLVIFLLQRSQPTKPLWWTYFSRLLSPVKPESFPFLNSVLYNLSQRCVGVYLSWSFTLPLPRSFLLFESCFFFSWSETWGVLCNLFSNVSSTWLLWLASFLPPFRWGFHSRCDSAFEIGREWIQGVLVVDKFPFPFRFEFEPSNFKLQRKNTKTLINDGFKRSGDGLISFKFKLRLNLLIVKFVSLRTLLRLHNRRDSCKNSCHF